MEFNIHPFFWKGLGLLIGLRFLSIDTKLPDLMIFLVIY